ncbi:glucuronate isomerase [Mariniblastus fucicola]|uniref:Uronate isomerase n=1 Tax=Mariniblastus fucicola TaxID=980251 RepID=A0A5B9PL71_9BACT|nr:glucuronate isomerase [Mariniblastus fucicola]QEG23093.1 Uronate isomerase [Mariniblastus fucicola]
MFIDDDFLLQNESSKRLYHDHAADQPIIDYHNHLSPADIATNRRFDNLFDMWIDHDHYKWRAMRANGIPESHCTGDASPKEKFLAFAKTVPHTLRNPIFHWTHLELKRFFGIDELLNEDNAESVWDRCNEQIAGRDELRTRGILEKFKVTALCTTDDPTDALEHHEAIARDSKFEVGVFPAFRPDWSLFVHLPAEFQDWVKKLAASSGQPVGSFQEFLDAIRNRHDFFHSMGARLSDHGCQYIPSSFCDASEAESIFDAAMSGQAADKSQHDAFSTFMLLYLAELDYEKEWTNQFHVGVFRNNNTRLFEQVGRDLGCDSIGDLPQAGTMGRFFDALDRKDRLPRTIVYNLNPGDNYLVSTMIGNFQDGRIAGKMQFGSGWWYLDQMEGMLWQLNTLSNTGLLSRFVGMLTDSRSFMSFTRHEYFRRILCNLLGSEIESGLLPSDFGMIGGLVERICYGNAKEFLRLPVS